MHLCPFCGHVLPYNLKNGLASCSNCSRVFDSAPFHRLLSAGWLVRKESIFDSAKLIHYGFTQAEAILAVTFVHENSMSHEELVQALKDIGIDSYDKKN